MPGDDDLEPRAAVIVVGSITTALLVEALAHAGMLRFSEHPADLPCNRATVSRAATWGEAAAQAAMHAPCVAVATGPPPGLVLRDSAGEPVRIAQAEALLERSRQAPSVRAARRRAVGTIVSPRWALLTWLRRLMFHLQPARLLKPERREA